MILNLTDLSDEPLQRQISRQIRAMILAGDISAGQSLPSIRSLARGHQVSVITVQRAYEMLMRDDLIHSRRGKGFFVSQVTHDRKKELALKQLKEKLNLPINAAIAEGLTQSDITNTIKAILEETENDKSI